MNKFDVYPSGNPSHAKPALRIHDPRAFLTLADDARHLHTFRQGSRALYAPGTPLHDLALLSGYPRFSAFARSVKWISKVGVYARRIMENPPKYLELPACYVLNPREAVSRAVARTKALAQSPEARLEAVAELLDFPAPVSLYSTWGDCAAIYADPGDPGRLTLVVSLQHPERPRYHISTVAEFLAGHAARLDLSPLEFA